MKKRVLLVSCEGLGNGGVQAIMMGIVRNLYTEFHFDILLFTSEKRYFDDEFLSYGGKIFRVPKYEGTNPIRRRFDYYIRDLPDDKSITNNVNVRLLDELMEAYIYCRKKTESCAHLCCGLSR